MEECLFCGFIPIDFTEYSGAAVKVTLFKDAKEWLIDELESWDFTFEEETEIPKYINKIREDEILTEDEYKEILFHLWQKLH